jgi:2-(1,2-epoxy-1,2-dihydrophenyl)acetyl-CoA isomerase
MTIRTDRPRPEILRLLIDRPEKRNAVDAQTRQALVEALAAARGDAASRALVLGGTGGLFSAGGDLPSMVGMSEAQARERMRQGHQACRLVADSPVPVVSAAEGICAGAVVGLALLGDHIVVGKGSRILFPFLRLGLVPDWGLLRSLPARLGPAAARRILAAGRPIGGEEAAALGLADECVEDGKVMAAAVERAAALARLSPRAWQRMKQRLLRPSATLDEELQREEDDQTALFLGEDFREGYAAYAGKREPRFAAPAGGAA